LYGTFPLSFFPLPAADGKSRLSLLKPLSIAVTIATNAGNTLASWFPRDFLLCFMTTDYPAK
jgi:hypothetical protein